MLGGKDILYTLWNARMVERERLLDTFSFCCWPLQHILLSARGICGIEAGMTVQTERTLQRLRNAFHQLHLIQLLMSANFGCFSFLFSVIGILRLLVAVYRILAYFFISSALGSRRSAVGTQWNKTHKTVNTQQTMRCARTKRNKRRT